MGIRHLSRQRALQYLYAMEFAVSSGDVPLEVEHRFLNIEASHRRGWGPFAKQLTSTVLEHQRELDQKIGPLLKGWTLERLPRIDRIVLRMALAELSYFREIPLRVTINEYLELVRIFSGDESTQYINAVLDHLAREFPQKDFQSDSPAGTTPSSVGPRPAAPKKDETL